CGTALRLLSDIRGDYWIRYRAGGGLGIGARRGRHTPAAARLVRDLGPQLAPPATRHSSRHDGYAAALGLELAQSSGPVPDVCDWCGRHGGARVGRGSYRGRRASHALQRLLGCLLGGFVGLCLLALSLTNFLPWILTLSAAIWIGCYLQTSERGVSYIGTQ